MFLETLSGKMYCGYCNELMIGESRISKIIVSVELKNKN